MLTGFRPSPGAETGPSRYPHEGDATRSPWTAPRRPTTTLQASLRLSPSAWTGRNLTSENARRRSLPGQRSRDRDDRLVEGASTDKHAAVTAWDPVGPSDDAAHDSDEMLQTVQRPQCSRYGSCTTPYHHARKFGSSRRSLRPASIGAVSWPASSCTHSGWWSTVTDPAPLVK